MKTKNLVGIAGVPLHDQASTTTSSSSSAAVPFFMGDAKLMQEGDGEVTKLLYRYFSSSSAPSSLQKEGQQQEGEVLSWVDNHGTALLPGGLPRLLVHKHNILHKGAGIFVRDREVSECGGDLLGSVWCVGV